jgi:site-specific DNA recombinase
MRKHGPMTAAIYIRVSSDDQKKGYGPQYQREETLKIAVERDGCLVRPEHIIDDSKSGSTDNRPGWKKILALAHDRLIDAVYFWKLDRMMRDEYYFYVNERELRDAGVELRFATQDLKDPFNRAIQVAVAAEERRKIKERTYAGRIRAIRDGKWIGIAPYGYHKDKNFRLQIYPREAEWVKRFFVWLVNEHLSLGKIAMRGRELCVPTRYDTSNKKKPRNGPYFWSKGTLKRLLSSEVYTGTAWFLKYQTSDDKSDPSKLRPESEWIKVSVPPLVSQQTLQQAREQLAKNRLNSPRRTKRTYLFAKKLRCGGCGRVLVAGANPNSRYKFYRGTYFTDNRCLDCRQYSERALELAIWPGLVSFFRDPETFLSVVEKHQKRNGREEQLEHQRSEIAALEERLKRSEKRLLDCDLTGFYSRTVLEEKRKEIEADRKRLEDRKHELSRLALAEQQRQQTVASARTLYEKIQKRLDTPDYETKRRAIALFIEKVVLIRDRADVWLTIPGDMFRSQVALRLSAEDEGAGPMSLCSTLYVECDTKAPVDWMPVIFSVEVKPRYPCKNIVEAGPGRRPRGSVTPSSCCRCKWSAVRG